jgi:shikimate kinase
MNALAPRKRAVILVGFMGAGKSSVGRALAQRLSWTFADLDERIERSEGRSIAEIFRHDGEVEFRRMEYKALRQLLQQAGEAGLVMALGGGAFAHPPSFAVIEEAAIPTVFLDADVEELWARCTQQAKHEGLDRPLLATPQEFRNLYETRRRHYLKAQITHATSGRTVDEIARSLAEVLQLGR